MSERSLIAFEHYRDASQRFDYFVLGVSGALCAYISQNLKPHKLDFSPYTLEVISLLVLVASVFAGFKLMEKRVRSHLLNHRFLDMSEKRGQFVSNFQGRSQMNLLTGVMYTPEEIKRHVEEIDREVQALEPELNRTLARGKTWYDLRNWFLAIGFVGLVISKILVPYFP